MNKRCAACLDVPISFGLHEHTANDSPLLSKNVKAERHDLGRRRGERFPVVQIDLQPSTFSLRSTNRSLRVFETSLLMIKTLSAIETSLHSIFSSSPFGPIPQKKPSTRNGNNSISFCKEYESVFSTRSMGRSRSAVDVIALLLADRLSAEQRKAVGSTLVLVGLVTTDSCRLGSIRQVRGNRLKVGSSQNLPMRPAKKGIGKGC
jgi:hypothetical protein